MHTFKINVVENWKQTSLSAHVLQDNFFLIADDYSHSIYQLDHSLTSSSVVMAAKYDRPIGVVYDMNETRLYWSEFDQGLIRRARIDGTAAQTITNYRAGEFRGWLNKSRLKS